jgi:hypothetical protein
MGARRPRRLGPGRQTRVEAYHQGLWNPARMRQKSVDVGA